MKKCSWDRYLLVIFSLAGQGIIFCMEKPANSQARIKGAVEWLKFLLGEEIISEEECMVIGKKEGRKSEGRVIQFYSKKLPEKEGELPVRAMISVDGFPPELVVHIADELTEDNEHGKYSDEEKAGILFTLGCDEKFGDKKSDFIDLLHNKLGVSKQDVNYCKRLSFGIPGLHAPRISVSHSRNSYLPDASPWSQKIISFGLNRINDFESLVNNGFPIKITEAVSSGRTTVMAAIESGFDTGAFLICRKKSEKSSEMLEKSSFLVSVIEDLNKISCSRAPYNSSVVKNIEAGLALLSFLDNKRVMDFLNESRRNERFAKRMTPLMIAASMGDEAFGIIERLLELGVEQDKKVDGMTALKFARRSDSLGKIIGLLKDIPGKGEVMATDTNSVSEPSLVLEHGISQSHYGGSPYYGGSSYYGGSTGRWDKRAYYKGGPLFTRLISSKTFRYQKDKN